MANTFITVWAVLLAGVASSPTGPIAIEPLTSKLGEASDTAAAAPDTAALAAPAPAPKAASAAGEVQMAEVEWKDAYDSTVAPGKYKAPIVKLPDASDHTWMKQIVESMKKGDEKQDLSDAQAALTQAESLMEDSPKDEDDLPKDEGNTMAATIKAQEASTEDLKALIKKFTDADPVTQQVKKRMQKLKEETEDAERQANEAKAALEAQVKATQDKLSTQREKEMEQVKVLKQAKAKAVQEAAHAMAHDTQER